MAKKLFQNFFLVTLCPEKIKNTKPKSYCNFSKNSNNPCVYIHICQNPSNGQTVEFQNQMAKNQFQKGLYDHNMARKIKKWQKQTRFQY